MKTVEIVAEVSDPLHTVVLKDFSHFEEKMTKIRHLKIFRQNLDKRFIAEAIESLGVEGKRVTAKKVKKICKKALANMMEEVEQ